MAIISILPSEPIRRRWAPDPLGLVELWRHEAPRMVRLFGLLRNEDLDARGAEGSRSIGELLQHIIDSVWNTIEWSSGESGKQTSVTAQEIGDFVAALQCAYATLFATLDRLAAARFEEVIAPFGVPETRAVMALGMFKHELHHRGELQTLARIRGRSVPSLYAPVASQG